MYFQNPFHVVEHSTVVLVEWNVSNSLSWPITLYLLRVSLFMLICVDQKTQFCFELRSFDSEKNRGDTGLL